MKRQPLCAFFLATLAIPSGTAIARPNQAAKLVDQALEEFDNKNYAAACPLFEQSLALEKNSGTRFSLAKCLDVQGKSIEALGHYEQFNADFSQFPASAQKAYESIHTEALQRIQALKQVIPRLKLKMPPDAPRDIVVSLDDSDIPAAKLDQVHYLKAGSHKIAVDVPGRKRIEWEVELQERQPLEELIRIPEAPPTPPVLPAAPMSVPVKPMPHEPPIANFSGWTGRGVVMVAAGSFALAGTITGGIPWVMAWNKKGDIDAHCVNQICDTPAWTLEAQKAATRAEIGTIGAAVAGVGLVVLFGTLIGGKPKNTKPHVIGSVLQIDSAGVTFGLKGAF